ncbi:MAG: putative membrane protein [Gammaproteobacteria bacterium]|jgi:putative membrane protein
MESILQELHVAPMVGTVVYSLLGFIVFYVGFVLFDKFTPFSIRKEIEEDQNVALGIIIGAGLIAFSIIISAAIRS